MPLVRLFGRANGGGLARDMRLAQGVLERAGITVDVMALGKEKGIRNLRIGAKWLARPLQGRADLQISFEHPYPMSYRLGRRDLLVPNPEMFRPHWHDALPHMDALLCKTRHAERIFRGMGRDARYCGFTSEDRLDRDVPRERVFLHMAGKSPVKGTAAVIEAWRRHPEWPRLVLLQCRRNAKPLPPMANVERRVGFVQDDELRRLQNACAFHLCPSEAEGFGHYLMEALSTGAVVATSDGEPMNELVTAGAGVLVRPASIGELGLARRFVVDADGIEQAVDRMLGMDASECAAMSRAARARFEQLDRAFQSDFPQRVLELVPN